MGRLPGEVEWRGRSECSYRAMARATRERPLGVAAALDEGPRCATIAQGAVGSRGPCTIQRSTRVRPRYLKLSGCRVAPEAGHPVQTSMFVSLCEKGELPLRVRSDCAMNAVTLAIESAL